MTRENLLASARSDRRCSARLIELERPTGRPPESETVPSIVAHDPVAEEILMDMRGFSRGAIGHVAHIARLDVSDRQEMLGPVVDGIYALIDQLDDVQLGETPPAIGFDPRWEA